MHYVQDKVAKWLVEDGLRVEKLEKTPPGLEIEWGFDVFTQPPLVVNVKLFKPKGAQFIVAFMGVSFSQEHRKAVAALDPREKMKLSSELLLTLLAICPSARIGLQPSVADPAAVGIEERLYLDDLSREKVVKTVWRLVNAFIAVNAVLWKRFPEAPRDESQLARFM